jgi:hypothetical protein
MDTGILSQITTFGLAKHTMATVAIAIGLTMTPAPVYISQGVGMVSSGRTAALLAIGGLVYASSVAADMVGGLVFGDMQFINTRKREEGF